MISPEPVATIQLFDLHLTPSSSTVDSSSRCPYEGLSSRHSVVRFKYRCFRSKESDISNKKELFALEHHHQATSISCDGYQGFDVEQARVNKYSIHSMRSNISLLSLLARFLCRAKRSEQPLIFPTAVAGKADGDKPFGRSQFSESGGLCRCAWKTAKGFSCASLCVCVCVLVSLSIYPSVCLALVLYNRVYV